MAIFEFLKNLSIFGKRKHESVQGRKRARTSSGINGEEIGKELNALVLKAKKNQKRAKRRKRKVEQKNEGADKDTKCEGLKLFTIGSDDSSEHDGNGPRVESVEPNQIIDFDEWHREKKVEPWNVYAMRVERAKKILGNFVEYKRFVTIEHQKLFGDDSRIFQDLKRKKVWDMNRNVKSIYIDHRHRDDEDTIIKDEIECIKCLEYRLYQEVGEEVKGKIRLALQRLSHHMYCDRSVLLKRLNKPKLDLIMDIRNILIGQLEEFGCAYHGKPENNLANKICRFDDSVEYKEDEPPRYRNGKPVITFERPEGSRYEHATKMRERARYCKRLRERLFVNDYKKITGFDYVPRIYPCPPDKYVPVARCLATCPFVGPLNYMLKQYGWPEKDVRLHTFFGYDLDNGTRVLDCGCEAISKRGAAYVYSNKSRDDYKKLCEENEALRRELEELKGKHAKFADPVVTEVKPVVRPVMKDDAARLDEVKSTTDGKPYQYLIPTRKDPPSALEVKLSGAVLVKRSKEETQKEREIVKKLENFDVYHGNPADYHSEDYNRDELVPPIFHTKPKHAKDKAQGEPVQEEVKTGNMVKRVEEAVGNAKPADKETVVERERASGRADQKVMRDKSAGATTSNTDSTCHETAGTGAHSDNVNLFAVNSDLEKDVKGADVNAGAVNPRFGSVTGHAFFNMANAMPSAVDVGQKTANIRAPIVPSSVESMSTLEVHGKSASAQNTTTLDSIKLSSAAQAVPETAPVYGSSSGIAPEVPIAKSVASQTSSFSLNEQNRATPPKHAHSTSNGVTSANTENQKMSGEGFAGDGTKDSGNMRDIKPLFDTVTPFGGVPTGGFDVQGSANMAHSSFGKPLVENSAPGDVVSNRSANYSGMQGGNAPHGLFSTNAAFQNLQNNEFSLFKNDSGVKEHKPGSNQPVSTIFQPFGLKSNLQNGPFGNAQQDAIQGLSAQRTQFDSGAQNVYGSAAQQDGADQTRRWESGATSLFDASRSDAQPWNNQQTKPENLFNTPSGNQPWGQLSGQQTALNGLNSSQPPVSTPLNNQTDLFSDFNMKRKIEFTGVNDNRPRVSNPTDAGDSLNTYGSANPLFQPSTGQIDGTNPLSYYSSGQPAAFGQNINAPPPFAPANATYSYGSSLPAPPDFNNKNQFAGVGDNTARTSLFSLGSGSGNVQTENVNEEKKEESGGLNKLDGILKGGFSWSSFGPK
ncbi:hypothetical protein VCUG_01803 [Vavraia culicis subsp. floridensis]|uniref:Uncharacterized protein n=1 Tax=Vavraia culicis (isolate floridensis) TaxID=948595 RepID=L2GTM0_VAVCU|nr:uncharacterized protein VCUG_01803 [Vavraia culicis subsp. floridensis]ELA46717.1 hypothetical protein VCUG_01803 [Vavraia culicis subsp. floridensis]